jgi:hypothetical protein
MQVKPYFESYNILKQIFITKDDTGNDINLTLIEGKLLNTEYEVIDSSYKFWTVIGKNQVQWNNKTVSYESIAYWKALDKSLLNTEINDFIIEEVKDGFHTLFNEKGLRTKFKIKVKSK